MLGQEREAHRAVQAHSVVMVMVSSSGMQQTLSRGGSQAAACLGFSTGPRTARVPFPLDPPCRPPRPRDARSPVSGPAPVPTDAHRCGVHVKGGAGGALSPTVTQ